MDLYLVRHAIAFDRDPLRWPDDSQRPLTPEGKKRFRSVARGLQQLVPSVDAVFSSPYTRAVETARVLEKESGWPAASVADALGSDRPTSEALQFLQALTRRESIALVGHEPNLHELASLLLGGDAGSLHLEMRKGSVAALQFRDQVHPGAATLVWLAPPRLLRLLD